MAAIDLSRAGIEQYSLDMRQFADFRPATLANGLRIIDAYNASGLTFSVLPDRGLDLWLAAYNGKPLTWISQGAPHPPDIGAPWLRQFNGGMLVTCGLRHVGPPETDERSGEVRDLHGVYTRLRAHELATRAYWDGDRYTLELTGAVAEASFFGEQLRLTRTLRLRLGEPAVEITDAVENLYDTPAPLMVLHHFNFGYPLVQEGVQLHVPTKEVHPRDMPARAAFGSWERYAGAAPRHQEEVFFHRVYADSQGMSAAALAGEEFGLMIEWDTTHEPYLTQWKNYRRGSYVCGVEPGNCVPEGQNRARRAGRLVMLNPGEQQRFRTRLTVLPDADAVAAMRNRIADLRTGGQPVNIELSDYDAS